MSACKNSSLVNVPPMLSTYLVEPDAAKIPQPAKDHSSAPKVGHDDVVKCPIILVTISVS
jgi:hypothetical protein